MIHKQNLGHHYQASIIANKKRGNAAPFDI